MADRKSSKAPAFQFYPNDFLSDEHVLLMSMQERGVYITLICRCWNEGTLPADVGMLARLCGMPVASFRRLWPSILPCFRASGDDRLAHPRLEKERKKQLEHRRRQSDAASKRWHQRGNASASPVIRSEPSQRNALQSSSSSSSSDFRHERTRSLAEEPDALTERAGVFARETYPALYAKFRKGARYLSKPNLDFLEAVELCRVWDDERLEKLAAVFLQTDHEFAEKGSRTMAQFRALASWCDSRLAEAGIA